MSRARMGARACESCSVSSPRIGLSERVCGAQNSADRGRGDIGIAADAEHRAAIWGGAFEIRRGRDVRTLADRVFVIICRSEEHTSELQSLMRISYAVFCLKNKNTLKIKTTNA